MAVQREVTCPMCGFKNAPDSSRCGACGARIERVSGLYTEAEVQQRRQQQEGFEWKWALAACFFYVVVQGAVLVGLPRVVATFDPQGLAGLFVSLFIWFLGGVAVGLISPRKNFIEPAVGVLFLAVPTVAYLVAITPPGFQPSLLAYIVGSLLGVMIAPIGAFIGDRLRSGPAQL
ncbi:MAG: zinc finger Ran-binding domain-containing protein [Proteobacteria bacterium]|nr:zinc finger Ran-binding domain-containing protein [Pseudomonadota bacterium]